MLPQWNLNQAVQLKDGRVSMADVPITTKVAAQ